jgi:hypothetical protein
MEEKLDYQRALQKAIKRYGANGHILWAAPVKDRATGAVICRSHRVGYMTPQAFQITGSGESWEAAFADAETKEAAK